MKQVLANLKPQRVFYYFEQLCNIPHGSGNTKTISDYCAAFAKERGLFYVQDEWNNVIIKKDASEGYEHVSPIILQGHLDMVCEKVAGCQHDFLNDPLDLIIDGDYVTANNTTLGGDDGIAIAFALAILDDDTICHPALEVVMTTEEETGMDGAQNLDCSILRGTHMINIDSEEEGSILVGCAGGAKVTCTFPITYEEKTGTQYTFTVSGLKGGHSGTDIDKQRASAILLLGRFLYFCEREHISLSISYMDGGGMDNAIAREATVSFLMEEAFEPKLKDVLHLFDETIKKEYAGVEDQMHFVIQKEDEITTNVFSEQTRQTIVAFLLNAFHGILTMSIDMKGMVESSSNLGILKTEENVMTFCFAARSSKESKKTLLVSKYTTLTKALGGEISVTSEYPGWDFKKDSTLQRLAIDTYHQVTGKQLHVYSIHAGLECGLFADKIPNLDAISMGPDILDIHTPKERLCISSVGRVYEYLLKLLKNTKDYMKERLV